MAKYNKQQYVIENVKSFEPKHVFECGQCFRWNVNKDNSYTGVVGNNVLNVKKINKDIIIRGFCDGDISSICKEYFDLETDYDNIKTQLSLKDEYLKHSIKYGYGIRILNQDLWETLISFIISANNNILRIKGIIERLSKAYGEVITYNRKRILYFSNFRTIIKSEC